MSFPSPYTRGNHRALDELRCVKFTPHFSEHAEGSVLIEVGHTKVLCNASVQDGVPSHKKGSGEGWITAEYAMLPRATHTRNDRESVKGKQNARSQEIQRLIGRSLRAAFDLKKLGDRTIVLDCDVLQADGGTRCASITGAFVATCLAINRLFAAGKLQKDPLITYIAAVSVGIKDSQVFLDLDYAEDSACDTDMNVVQTESQRFVEIQGTAEGSPFSKYEVDQMLALASQGIAKLIEFQRGVLNPA